MEKELVLECSEKLGAFLDALLATGMFGPTRETCAQRLLELKIFEMSKDWFVHMRES